MRVKYHVIMLDTMTMVIARKQHEMHKNGESCILYQPLILISFQQ